MDLRLSFPALLLCLVFLMCGGGNAVRDLEEKYATAYFHKTPSSADQLAEGHDVKNLEQKYSTAYFHKTSSSADHLNEDDDVNTLEQKYSTAYFHKTPSSADHLDEGGDVKNLEEKYSTAYFHKTPSAADHLNESDDVKNLEHKYSTAYFHKTHSSADHLNENDEMKNLEHKYSTAYFHKTHSSADHLNENDEMKNLEHKYSTAYFHKTSQQTSQMMKDYHNHAKIGLFTLDEVRGFIVGKKLPIFFPVKNHSLYPPFLPKEFAETIPFSSSRVSEIMQFLSVSPDSPKGKAVQDTLQKCQLKAAQGETKICATSSESLHGFLSTTFGPEVHFKFISTTHPTITTPIFQNYTILESPQEIQSPKKVACHPMPYLYAVYFCHFDATETKAFKLQLVGDITGDKVDALLLCHMDTSGWSSDHTAFRMLGIKHGNAVCHVFSQGNLVWIESSDIAVNAM